MHVANMSKRPISSAKEFVKRGQDVWVKVLSTQTSAGASGMAGGLGAQRITLSMRDVDQATGERAWWRGGGVLRPVGGAWGGVVVDGRRGPGHG